MMVMLLLPIGEYLFFSLAVFSFEFFYSYSLLFASHRSPASTSGGVVPPTQPTTSIEVVDVLSMVMPPPKASFGLFLRRWSAK